VAKKKKIKNMIKVMGSNLGSVPNTLKEKESVEERKTPQMDNVWDFLATTIGCTIPSPSQSLVWRQVLQFYSCLDRKKSEKTGWEYR